MPSWQRWGWVPKPYLLLPTLKVPSLSAGHTEESLSQDSRGPTERRLRNSSSGALSLEQQSSNRDSVPKETLGNVCRHFGCHSWVGGGGGAVGIWWAEMLLNVLRCPGQPHRKEASEFSVPIQQWYQGGENLAQRHRNSLTLPSVADRKQMATDFSHLCVCDLLPYQEGESVSSPL